MEILIIKIIKEDENKWWIKKGNFMIIPKLKLIYELQGYKFKYKVLCKLIVPDGMYSYYHYCDSLQSLIRKQEGAIKSARTSYRRIPIRKGIISKLKTLLPEVCNK